MPQKKEKKSSSGSPPKRPKKKKGGYLWAVLAIASVTLVTGIVYLLWERPSTIKKGAEVSKTVSLPPPAEVREKEAKPKIAIIIDDIGNSRKNDDAVLAINAPLTLSVLPLLPGSEKMAKKGGSNGKEVMLHLPMEPHGYPETNPGPGTLFTDMDDIAIITQVYEDMKSVPGSKGVNNHMGSKFTEDGERMRIVLKQLKDKGLFFIDSKTSPNSHSEKMAREMGIKAGGRDVFLDNEQNEVYIAGQIEELKKVARRRGSAIGIGHPYPETIAVLRKAIPKMMRDFDIVHASELVR